MSNLVSIIVPAYNAEPYIRKCINSIQNQSYHSIEVIIVNDGSNDGTEEICSGLKRKDSRIKIFNQPNQGVTKARKAGVAAAQGNFIGWVDADDWIEPDYIEKMVRLQEETDADIIAAAHFHDIGDDSKCIKNGIECGIYRPEDILDKMICTGEFFEYGITPQLYSKLFRTAILKKTQTAVPENVIAGDDAAVVYPSALEAEKICVSDICGYHYVQNPHSITKSSFSNEKERVDALINFLVETLKAHNVNSAVYSQLSVYRNYLLALRQIEYFDQNSKGKFLAPYGGFCKGEKVVIYGAGVLGQKIYRYLNSVEGPEITDWLDMNYSVYRNNGYPVNEPEKLKYCVNEYDYVIIANITEKAAIEIKKYLLALKIEENKIRWFSKEFLGR